MDQSLDQNENMCRICRQESDHMESLYGVREGLPLSVITMIVCPIKVLKKDSLPKLICFECLEVIFSAYKLREESIESDRYFKTFTESNEIPEEADTQPIPRPIRIKDEGAYPAVYVDSLPVYDFSTSVTLPVTSKNRLPSSSSSSSIVELPAKSKKLSKRNEEEFPYEVDCYKTGPKSSAWDYFGQLVHKSNGQIVGSETKYFFCKLCVLEKKTIQNRYKRSTTSTELMFHHLQASHGIDKCEAVSEIDDSDFEIAPLATKDNASPEVIGLTFECPEENCDQVFKMKICLEIHVGIEHTGIADAEPASNEYNVEVSQKKASKTMCWKYFGPLLDRNLDLVDNRHHYCRLCVGDGKLQKYAGSVSTATLLSHLRSKHMKGERKRKRFRSRFEDEDLSD